jgi:hypothetical protein
MKLGKTRAYGPSFFRLLSRALLFTICDDTIRDDTNQHTLEPMVKLMQWPCAYYIAMDRLIFGLSPIQ